MAYNKQTWLDGKSGGTPISAARLNYLEQGLADARTIETFTTTQRNALTTGQKWEGRVIYNSTTDRLQQWDGAAWFTVPIDTDIVALLDSTGTPSALGTAARGTSGSAARADHVHPSGDVGATAVTAGASMTTTSTKSYLRGKTGHLNINATAGGTIASGATIFTLAAGHRPAEDWYTDVIIAGTPPTEGRLRIHLTTAGLAQVQGGLTNGQIIRGSASYPIP